MKKDKSLPMPFEKWLATRKKAPRAKTKRLPAVSKRRAQELREYSKLRETFLLENPLCEVWKHFGCRSPIRFSEEIHHTKGRTGKRLNDVKHWLAVSRWGHDQIHNNPKWAYEAGFLLPR